MTGRAPRGAEDVVDAATPLGTAGSTTGALVLAILVTGGAGLLWVVLATATGLIFHFLPGATFLAGAWAYRWRPTTGPARWPRVAAVLAAGLAATTAALVALTASGRPLDSGWLTAVISVAGAGLAAGWLRWKGVRWASRAAGAPGSDRPAARARQEEDERPLRRDMDGGAPATTRSD